MPAGSKGMSTAHREGRSIMDSSPADGTGAAGVVLVLAALALQTPGIGGGPNPYILIFAVVGAAFIYCWWRTRGLAPVARSAAGVGHD